VSLAVLQMSVGPLLATAQTLPTGDIPSPGTLGHPISPIKHVIVIIGENRSFDHIFATYQPQPGQTVHNLLSEGIIALDANKNAVQGPHFDKAQQLAATDMGPTDTFLLSPPKQKFPNNTLPSPLTPSQPEGIPGSGAYAYFAAAVPICAADYPSLPTTACIEYLAEITETGLPANTAPDSADANGLTYYESLITGGTGQPKHVPDARIANVLDLPAGPFQLTARAASPTLITRRAPCTASTRCGSS
jgi:phospholipase C